MTALAVLLSAAVLPSDVEIPTAGCRRISISSAGVSGSVVFVAVDDF